MDSKQLWNDALIDYCEQNDVDGVVAMIEAGATTYNKGLYVASSYGSTNVIDTLLFHGANNIQECIDIASFYGHCNIVDKLMNPTRRRSSKSNNK